MNVLHVIESLEVGGAENVIANLVNHGSDRFKTGICCLKRSGPIRNRIMKKEVEVFELGKGEGNDYSIPFKLSKVLKGGRIDVVVSHNWATFCETAIAAALADTPVRLHVQ